MKELISCIVTYKPNVDYLKLLIDKLNKLDIYTIIFDNTSVNCLNSQIVNADRIIYYLRKTGKMIYLLIRRHQELDYTKYMLFMILILHHKLGFFKTFKILLKALHHAIIGDLEMDNKNIIKNFKVN